jgi:DNA invertase Pin-like site-specific DNA recombinase
MQNAAMANKSYSKELVRRSTGREIDDLLRELYLDRRHSQQEIAEALGITRSLVGQWLAEYGISREDRPAVAL